MSSCLGTVLSFARLDSRERPVAVLLSAGPLPEKTIVERLGPIQDAVKTARAIVRLLRDGMIAAVRGLLRLTPWSVWPPNRLKPEDAQKLEQLVPWKDEPQLDVDDHQVGLANDPPTSSRDAERLEKIAARAAVVFGDDVAHEIRVDGQNIVRRAGSIKLLMAALLQTEAQNKPHPNPIALLIVIARKFAKTGIQDALWDRLEVAPLPIGTKPPPPPIVYWKSPFPEPTPEQRKRFAHQMAMLRKKCEVELTAERERRAKKDEFLELIRAAASRTVTIAGRTCQAMDRRLLLKKLRDHAIAENRLEHRCATLKGIELENELARVFEADPDWVQERTLAFVEATASRATTTDSSRVSS
jgi:hypothetical protein